MEHWILVAKREGGDYLEDVGADGKVILKLMFKNWNKEGRAGMSWFRRGTGGLWRASPSVFC